MSKFFFQNMSWIQELYMQIECFRISKERARPLKIDLAFIMRLTCYNHPFTSTNSKNISFSSRLSGVVLCYCSCLCFHFSLIFHFFLAYNFQILKIIHSCFLGLWLLSLDVHSDTFYIFLLFPVLLQKIHSI